jgi:hypothetical protein
MHDFWMVNGVSPKAILTETLTMVGGDHDRCWSGQMGEGFDQPGYSVGGEATGIRL